MMLDDRRPTAVAAKPVHELCWQAAESGLSLIEYELGALPGPGIGNPAFQCYRYQSRAQEAWRREPEGATTVPVTSVELYHLQNIVSLSLWGWFWSFLFQAPIPQFSAHVYNFLPGQARTLRSTQHATPIGTVDASLVCPPLLESGRLHVAIDSMVLLL